MTVTPAAVRLLHTGCGGGPGTSAAVLACKGCDQGPCPCVFCARTLKEYPLPGRNPPTCAPTKALHELVSNVIFTHLMTTHISQRDCSASCQTTDSKTLLPSHIRSLQYEGSLEKKEKERKGYYFWHWFKENRPGLRVHFTRPEEQGRGPTVQLCSGPVYPFCQAGPPLPELLAYSSR